MTQQTTLERITALLDDYIDINGDLRGGFYAVAVALIAAEIDRLTAERDEARAHNAELSTELAGANFEGNLAMIQRDEAYSVLKKRTAERDEAREQIAALEASNAEQAQMMADGFADAKEQSARLAEARAEVERLRPAAEAWIAYDDYMMCPEEHEAEKFQVWVAAHNAAKSAQVARAAKEAKP